MSIQRNTRPRYPGGRRVLWGVAAYAVGYLAVFLWLRGRVEATLSRVVLVTDPETLTLAGEVGANLPTPSAAGWLFYGAHMVDLTVFVSGEGLVRVNPATAAGGTAGLLPLLPPVLLALAGLAVTRDATSTTDLHFDVADRAWAQYAFDGGIVVLFGYLPLAGVGGLFTAFGSVGPNLLDSWMVAGFVYPVVFGGLGGVVAYAARYR